MERNYICIHYFKIMSSDVACNFPEAALESGVGQREQRGVNACYKCRDYPACIDEVFSFHTSVFLELSTLCFPLFLFFPLIHFASVRIFLYGY